MSRKEESSNFSFKILQYQWKKEDFAELFRPEEKPDVPKKFLLEENAPKKFVYDFKVLEEVRIFGNSFYQLPYLLKRPSDIEPLAFASEDDEFIPYQTFEPMAVDPVWTAQAMRRSPLVNRGMRFIMLGPYRTDGSVQAEFLRQSFGCIPISVAKLLVLNANMQQCRGPRVEAVMEMPEGYLIHLLMKRLGQPDVRENGFILTDFPRTLPQAEVLDELLRQYGWDVDCVFNMKTAENRLTYYKYATPKFDWFIHLEWMRELEMGPRTTQVLREMRQNVVDYYLYGLKHNVITVDCDKTEAEVSRHIETAVEQFFIRKQHAKCIAAERQNREHLVYQAALDYYHRLYGGPFYPQHFLNPAFATVWNLPSYHPLM